MEAVTPHHAPKGVGGVVADSPTPITPKRERGYAQNKINLLLLEDLNITTLNKNE